MKKLLDKLYFEKYEAERKANDLHDALYSAAPQPAPLSKEDATEKSHKRDIMQTRHAMMCDRAQLLDGLIDITLEELRGK